MTVTKVSISTNLVQNEGGRLLGFGSIELDGQIKIHCIRIVKTNDGRVLVCMPSIRGRSGITQDAVHPTNPETRAMITDAIMSELRRSRPGDYGLTNSES